MGCLSQFSYNIVTNILRVIQSEPQEQTMLRSLRSVVLLSIVVVITAVPKICYAKFLELELALVLLEHFPTSSISPLWTVGRRVLLYL